MQTGNDCDHVQRDEDQLCWDLEPLHQGEEVDLQGGPVCHNTSGPAARCTSPRDVVGRRGDFIYYLK